MRIVEAGEQDAHEGFAGLASDWRALQAQCRHATPFQTWEWNAAWWRHFGTRKRPHILLFWANASEVSKEVSAQEGAKEAAQSVTEDASYSVSNTLSGREERLVGIAPFYTSFHLGTPLRRLAWIGTGSSDYLGPLALSGWEEAVAEALRAYLDEQLRGWDIADLQQMRPEAPLLTQAIATQSRRASHAQSVLPIEPCPYVPLPADWTTFAARLGKKMRSNLGYYDRLLVKTFAEARYHAADANTLDVGMTALFDLHQKRWNARWLPGVLGSKRVQAFHRDIAQAFLANDWLRLHLLTVDGVIRAALYCFAFNGRTFYYLGGFAPELSKYSLGTLLTARAIRQAIEENCTEFDFLRGNEAYKYRWLPDERMNHRLLLLRSRDKLGGLGELPGRAGFALNRVERYVAVRAKAFAEHQGRKERPSEAPATSATSTLDAVVAPVHPAAQEKISGC